MDLRLDQQCHGYKSGHQILASSIQLAREDQDVIDRLSDISGPLQPGERFEPYLTTYPLPSGSLYIVARTWQDLSAPRAGCVLTRSVLIPVLAWESLDFVASLTELLAPVNKDESTLGPIYFRSHPLHLPPVFSKRSAGLIEAIFLEERKPIVMFDEQESERIALRLLTSFWPGMRRGFTTCTLALSPRAVAGRPFDLMFAPRSARSRFARWNGRVIDVGASPLDNAVRHRWTSTAVKHIFENDPPNLMQLDALGVLRFDEQGDESNLRLALLWNELLEKANYSPTAVLGLLDIVKSRQPGALDGIRELAPLILRSIDVAQSSMPPFEALRFILTLLVKFTDQRAPEEVLWKSKYALSRLAEQNPSGAVSLLRDLELGKWMFAEVVSGGIGDGLSHCTDEVLLFSVVTELRPENLCALLAYSPEFAGTVMSSISLLTDKDWITALANALRYPDDDLRAKSRKNVLSLFRVPGHAPLLSAVLHDVDTATLVEAAKEVGEVSEFEVAAFDDEFRRAARAWDAMHALRTAVLELNASPGSDRFLVSLLQPDAGDVQWLFAESQLTSDRRTHLLTHLLSNASERDIQSIAQHVDLSERIESDLLKYIPQTATLIARMLIAGPPATEQLLQYGSQVLPFTAGGTRSELGHLMLSRGLSSGPVAQDSILRELFAAASDSTGARELITLAMPWSASVERLTHNIAILNGDNLAVRRVALSEIEELTQRLIRRNLFLPSSAVEAWGDLLRDAGEVNQRAQMRAASAALSYALTEQSQPLSRIVVETFPLVYGELKAGREAPGILSFFFTDWDRCKTARRDLVRAFLHSNWPAMDLVKAAFPTGDLESILACLLREKDAGRFLRRLRVEIESLPEAERSRMAAILSETMAR